MYHANAPCDGILVWSTPVVQGLQWRGVLVEQLGCVQNRGWLCPQALALEGAAALWAFCMGSSGFPFLCASCKAWCGAVSVGFEAFQLLLIMRFLG